MKYLFTLILLCSAMVAYTQENKKIIIIRHGHGEHNVVHRYNSNPAHPNHTPAHLTPQGIMEVETTARFLLDQGITASSIGEVWVSPLPRTLETATILANYGVIHETQITHEPLIIECQAGDAEGCTGEELGIPDIWNIDYLIPFGGEGEEHLQARIQQLFDKIQNYSQTGHLVIITHGTPARVLTQLITQQAPERLKTSEARFLDFPSMATEF